MCIVVTKAAFNRKGEWSFRNDSAIYNIIYYNIWHR